MIDNCAARSGGGYITYQGHFENGLVNQGWKDSGDAIVNADGKLARPFIALPEVQGYVFLAKLSVADLFEGAGEADRAATLRGEARELQTRFNRDFWCDDLDFYALALQADHAPAAVISSNPGHAMWTGIIDSRRAGAVVARLPADDMFSGWGIRTLSESEQRYNPVGYHLGTVWPHDNAFIAAGFRRYGFDREACRVIMGMLDAAQHFEHSRLPEVFTGVTRKDYEIPVRYPVACHPQACHPQAWAAGAVPHLLQVVLGLQPQGFERRLHVNGRCCRTSSISSRSIESALPTAPPISVSTALPMGAQR